MTSMFIKMQNTIINREQVCSVQYWTRENKATDVTNHYSKCEVDMTDGRHVIYWDAAADEMWNVFSDAGIDLTPVIENGGVK